MRVFIAGATGVLGSRVVPLLVEAGHEVTGVARSETKSAELAKAGATPSEVDLFSAEAVAEATKGYDAIINVATHVPVPKAQARASAWEENTRVRTDISANVADAARANGIARLVQESLWLIYDDRGAEWIDESAPLNAAPLIKPALVAESNALALNELDGHDSVALRFAQFYAPDSNQFLDQIDHVRRGKLGVIGKADAYMSQLDVDDAASAVVAALAVPPGPYNVVDNEPPTRGQWLEVMADVLGRDRIKFPRRQPLLMVGDKRLGGVQRSLRVSNQKLREASEWTPRWERSLDGIADAISRI
jgi:nucleoside-diphosphate-sugar epimerase